MEHVIPGYLNIFLCSLHIFPSRNSQLHTYSTKTLDWLLLYSDCYRTASCVSLFNMLRLNLVSKTQMASLKLDQCNLNEGWVTAFLYCTEMKDERSLCAQALLSKKLYVYNSLHSVHHSKLNFTWACFSSLFLCKRAELQLFVSVVCDDLSVPSHQESITLQSVQITLN